jgi:hypothetical protein
VLYLAELAAPIRQHGRKTRPLRGALSPWQQPGTLGLLRPAAQKATPVSTFLRLAFSLFTLAIAAALARGAPGIARRQMAHVRFSRAYRPANALGRAFAIFGIELSACALLALSLAVWLSPSALLAVTELVFFGVIFVGFDLIVVVVVAEILGLFATRPSPPPPDEEALPR